MRENLDVSPRSMEQVRQEALLKLQLDRAVILKGARNASAEDAWRYCKISTDTDMLILERYTQLAKESSARDHVKKKGNKTGTE